MILQGIAWWANITVPNTKYAPAYQVDLVVDEETAQHFRDKEFNVKEKDYGTVLTIKRKQFKNDGTERKVPKLMDKSKRPLDEAVGNGSLVRVQCREWEMPPNADGEVFRGLELQGVQVLELVPFAGADGEEFDVVDSEGNEDTDSEEL